MQEQDSAWQGPQRCPSHGALSLFYGKPAGRHLAELLFANEMRNEGVGGAGERVLNWNPAVGFFFAVCWARVGRVSCRFGSRSTSYGSRLGPY